jgi:hypothetical protein
MHSYETSALSKRAGNETVGAPHNTDHLGRTTFTWYIEAQRFLSIMWSDENGIFPNTIPPSSLRPLLLPYLTTLLIQALKIESTLLLSPPGQPQAPPECCMTELSIGRSDEVLD